MISTLAKRYSQALYDYSQEKDCVEKVYGDLAVLEEAILHSPEFVNFLKNPIAATGIREEALAGIFEKKVSGEFLRFLFLLSRKNRLSILPSICRAFRDLYREAHGILPVKIFSSLPLSKEECQSISEYLEKKFSKKIEPQFTVDASLIGGIAFQVRDQVYDFSLKAQLRQFKEKLVPA